MSNIEKLKKAETVLIEISQTKFGALLGKLPVLICTLLDLVKIMREHEEKLHGTD